MASGQYDFDLNLDGSVSPVPADYAASLDSIAPGFTSTVEQQQQPGESWVDALARTLPLIVTTVQQNKLLNVQVERAKQGLPPLNTSQYAIGANVGLSPELQKLVMVGGLAALGIAAFYVLSQHHRR